MIEEFDDLLKNARNFDANKSSREGNLNRPFYDPKWRRRDYESELCDNNQSMEDLVDELSRSKEDDSYLYGIKF